MNLSEKRLKQINLFVAVIYALTLLYAFIINYESDKQAFYMGFVSILCPLIVPLLFRLFHFQPVYEIYILSTCFCYFASLIGSCLGGYSLFFFDKVVHFCSGLFATLAAMILFYLIRQSNRLEDRKCYRLFLVFINACNMAIALLWEYYEYAMLIFFDNDCINHYTQGVHDSITDTMSAFVGGILITLFVMRAYHSKKQNFFTRIPEVFYERNIRKTQ